MELFRAHAITEMKYVHEHMRICARAIKFICFAFAHGVRHEERNSGAEAHRKSAPRRRRALGRRRDGGETAQGSAWGRESRRRRPVARLSPRLFRRQAIAAVGLKDRSRAGALACFLLKDKSRQWLKAKSKARRSRAGAAPE